MTFNDLMLVKSAFLLQEIREFSFNFDLTWKK